MYKIKLFTSFIVLFLILVSCSKIKELTGTSEILYFCEKYDGKEIGKSSKFTTGTLTVMVDLRDDGKKIGLSAIDINVTDLGTGKVVDTFPFTVDPDWDYIHFDDVDFKKPGKFKVSCLKKDGTVIASGEVEIVSR